MYIVNIVKEITGSDAIGLVQYALPRDYRKLDMKIHRTETYLDSARKIVQIENLLGFRPKKKNHEQERMKKKKAKKIMINEQ